MYHWHWHFNKVSVSKPHLHRWEHGSFIPYNYGSYYSYSTYVIMIVTLSLREWVVTERKLAVIEITSLRLYTGCDFSNNRKLSNTYTVLHVLASIDRWCTCTLKEKWTLVMTASTNFSENNAIQQHKQLLLNCKEYISSLVGLVACVVELQGIHFFLSWFSCLCCWIARNTFLP